VGSVRTNYIRIAVILSIPDNPQYSPIGYQAPVPVCPVQQIRFDTNSSQSFNTFDETGGNVFIVMLGHAGVKTDAEQALTNYFRAR